MENLFGKKFKSFEVVFFGQKWSKPGRGNFSKTLLKLSEVRIIGIRIFRSEVSFTSAPPSLTTRLMFGACSVSCVMLCAVFSCDYVCSFCGETSSTWTYHETHKPLHATPSGHSTDSFLNTFSYRCAVFSAFCFVDDASYDSAIARVGGDSVDMLLLTRVRRARLSCTRTAALTRFGAFKTLRRSKSFSFISSRLRKMIRKTV